MALLVDTTVLIEAERSRELPRIEQNEVAISVIAVSELLHAAEHGSDQARARRRAFAERVLEAWEAIPITTAVARVHARLWAELESRGELLDAHDLWIASTALAHGFDLVTLDADFARVPGLRVVAP